MPRLYIIKNGRWIAKPRREKKTKKSWPSPRRNGHLHIDHRNASILNRIQHRTKQQNTCGFLLFRQTEFMVFPFICNSVKNHDLFIARVRVILETASLWQQTASREDPSQSTTKTAEIHVLMNPARLVFKSRFPLPLTHHRPTHLHLD